MVQRNAHTIVSGKRAGTLAKWFHPRGAKLLATVVLTAWLTSSALAQAAKSADSSAKREIYTMRDEYEIVPQGDGASYALHRLAKDGSIVETIILTKDRAKNGKATYVDRNGSKYTQLSDGNLQEERAPDAAGRMPLAPSERPPQQSAPQTAPVGQRAAQPATRPAVEPPPLAVEAPPPPLAVEAPPRDVPKPTPNDSPPPVASPSHQPYNGPTSGTLNCEGSPIPQNGEKVFANLPGLKLELHYDKNSWEARLSPGPDQTQRLVLRSKKPGLQRKCVVHWNVIP